MVDHDLDLARREKHAGDFEVSTGAHAKQPATGPAGTAAVAGMKRAA